METASWKKSIPYKFIYSSIRTPKSSEKNATFHRFMGQNPAKVKPQMINRSKPRGDGGVNAPVVLHRHWARKDGHGVYG